MRQIVFDTETTGLEPEQGHRIIEIGAIELVNRRRTGRQFHRYLCPEREIDPGAVQVHGLTTEFLSGQPRFAEVFAELREFVAGAELIIHNAPFDVAFLDAEMQAPRRGRAWSRRATTRDVCGVLDTLALARQMHPGPAQQPRRAVQALLDRQLAPRPARRAARRRPAARGLPRDDGRAGRADARRQGDRRRRDRGRGASAVRPAGTLRGAARPRMTSCRRTRRCCSCSTRRAAARPPGAGSSPAPTPLQRHEAYPRAIVRPGIPRPVAGLVQAHHPRVPAAESDRDAAGRTDRHRLAAARAVHLHAGDGAALLSAAARRPAGDPGRPDRPDHAGERVRGSHRRVPGDPAADLHGRGHLLPARPAAVRVHAADPARSVRARCWRSRSAGRRRCCRPFSTR